METSSKGDLEQQMAQLRASLATAEADRDKFKGIAEGSGAGIAAAQGTASDLASQLEGEKKVSAKALAQVEILNQQIAAFRRQLAALESALDASEKKAKESQTQIANLGQRLNLALAQRVEELKSYRYDIIGRLRQIIGKRTDFRI